MLDFLKGSRTYASLVVALLGYFGLAEFVSESEVAGAVDSVLQLVGIVSGVYFRYKATE